MESGTDRRGPRQHLAQRCVIGVILCGGAAMFTLWYAMKYWVDCGSGIFAGAVVVVVWPALTALNGVVFTLVLVVARAVVGWAAALVTAALVLALVTVAVMDLSFYIVNPVNFPPWDVDGYATSDAAIARCVSQVLS